MREAAAILGDFSPQARSQPGASPVSSTKLITERSSTTMLVLREFRGQHYEAHSQWGLNE